MAVKTVLMLLQTLLRDENVPGRAELQSTGELLVSLRVNGVGISDANEAFDNTLDLNEREAPNTRLKRSSEPAANPSSTKRQTLATLSDDEATPAGNAEKFTVIDLNSGRPDATNASIPDDSKLIWIYPQLSNRNLHAYYPTVWDSNGKFTIAYDHLRNTPRGSPPRTIPTKEWIKWCELFGRIFQCYPVDVPKIWHRIVVSITRSSGTSPIYGRGGMVDRATTAASAWTRLHPQDSALLIVHTRARVSSSAALSTRGASMQEIRRLLSAANTKPGTRVVISVRIDALTTDVPSLAWLSQEYPNVNITIIYVVQDQFPDAVNFPTSCNGIRYWKFELAEIVRAIGGEPATPAAQLIKILDLINKGKGGYGGLSYREWTLGRNAFRVCPESKTESGIAEDRPLMSRGLH